MQKQKQKKKNKPLKSKAEIEAEIAAQQIQSKRYHQKVKESGKIYKRKDAKRAAVDQTMDQTKEE